MLRKIATALSAAVSQTKRDELKKQKLAQHVDWRPEAQAKHNRNKKLSKLSH